MGDRGRRVGWLWLPASSTPRFHACFAARAGGRFCVRSFRLLRFTPLAVTCAWRAARLHRLFHPRRARTARPRAALRTPAHALARRCGLPAHCATLLFAYPTYHAGYYPACCLVNAAHTCTRHRRARRLNAAYIREY